ncbi:MAG: transglycosylase SLT domain-containing protein [Pseudoflavonifractor sp.]|nr:transglycosylase SLT domain-containing protein [Pseudoflavonifractor sp.]
MKKFLISLLTSCTAIIASAGPSILSIKQSITDDAIVYPESFETDTHKMMHNWYLQNYAVLDEGVNSLSPASVSDEELIRRLSLMPTVIEMPFNQIVRSYIVMYTERRRSLVENMLGMSLYYMPIFEQALEREGMPLELKYLPIIESALNPDAVSRAGATGLWQFMLGTAKTLGMEVNSIVDLRRDPYTSSQYAAKYLKQLYNIYNDWSLAIAAYNCGPGNVNKALRRAGGDEPKDFWAIYHYLPRETRGYVPAFIAANYVMTYYRQHNISPALARRPLITDTIHVTKRVHLQQIADVLRIPIEEIRILNPQFRRDIIPGDIKPYALTLPSKQVSCYIMSEDSIVSHNAPLYARRDVVEPTDIYASTGDYETRTVVKYHKVRKGENLTKIARRYGVSVADLRKWNGIRRKGGVKRGQSLRINTYERVAKPKPKREEESGEMLASADTDNNTTATTDPTGETTVTPADATETTTAPKATKSDVPLPPRTRKNRDTAQTAVPKPNNRRTSDSEGTVTAKADTKDTAKGGTKAKAEPTGTKSGKESKTTANKSSKADKAKADKTKAEKAAPKYRYHKVRKGETLSQIANKYRGVSVKQIQKANGISGNKIQTGQRLKIPQG